MPAVTRRRILGSALAASLAARLACAARHAAGPPLWVAEQGEARVFLFGQMAVKRGSRWLSATIQQAFAASSELWTENPDPAAASRREGPSSAPAGPTLSQAASGQDMARLHAVLARAGLVAQAFDRLPLSAAYPAVAELADRALGADDRALPERVLRTRARAAGKTVRSEWVSFQQIAHYLDALSPQLRTQVELENFRRALDDAEHAGQAEQRLEQWLAGQLGGLEALERHLRAAYPLASRLIGTERNRLWVPRIRSDLQRLRSTFVCVGILHLIGPTSIQAFLRQSGVRVHRV